MNKVILIGNLTRDPELKQTSSGISVCNFSIAVNRNFTNANGERETDFFNIVTWRTVAENCGKYLSKGKKVAICGQLQSRPYEDKSGAKRTTIEVVAEDVEFLGGNKNEGAEPNRAPKTAQVEQEKINLDKLKPVEDDGLPF